MKKETVQEKILKRAAGESAEIRSPVGAADSPGPESGAPAEADPAESRPGDAAGKQPEKPTPREKRRERAGTSGGKKTGTAGDSADRQGSGKKGGSAEESPGQQLLAIERKILRSERIRTAVIVALLLPLTICGIFTMLYARQVRTETEIMTKQVQSLSQNAEILAEQMSAVNTLSTALMREVDPGELADTLAAVRDTLASVSGAADTLAGLDIGEVNGLIGTLKTELKGLSGALDVVRELDPDAVNNLLGQLDEIMEKVDRISNALEILSKWKLFG